MYGIQIDEYQITDSGEISEKTLLRSSVLSEQFNRKITADIRIYNIVHSSVFTKRSEREYGLARDGVQILNHHGLYRIHTPTQTIKIFRINLGDTK